MISALVKSLSKVCTLSTWQRPHSCGSASSPVARAWRRSSCARGSAGTASWRRSGRRAATGSTRTTTSGGCGACASCSRPASRRRRRPGRRRPSLELRTARCRRTEPRPPSCAGRSSSSMTPARMPRSTASSPTTPPAPCLPTSCCRSCTSSGQGGSGARSRSRRSTSHQICSAAGCSGWRITFLGADTPSDTIVDSVRRLEPEALVLAVTDSARLDGVAETAARLGDMRTAVWTGGAGAAEVDGARVLAGSPLDAAEQVAA